MNGIEFEKSFGFNSAHFVLYKGFREPLHGHNYNVCVKILGTKLNENGFVFDKDLISEITTNLCKSFKNNMLLPKRNPFLKLREVENNIEAT